jgi:RNA polymerase sigma-70 factor, ECF subfamily
MSRDDPAPSSTVLDLAILGKVLEEHRSRLVAAVRRRIDPVLAGRIDPEDVVNSAFELARRKWPKFEERSAASTYAWLYRIVRDRLIDVWRHETRAGRDPRVEMPWPDDSSLQLGLGLVSPGTSPSEAAIREELRERVRRVMSMLKEKDQEILWMRHFDELSYKEIAAVLDIAVNTAEQRYHRALGRLSDLWQQLQSDTGSGP